MKSILFQNITLVNADSVSNVDVLVNDGMVDTIDVCGSISTEAHQVFDGQEKIMLPAGIDPHVHMQLPTPAGLSSDSFYSGSKAAMAGGTYAMIDFVTPIRGESIIEALDNRILELGESLVNTKLHVGLSWWSPQVAEEVRICIQERGIRSFKVYLAYLDTIGLKLSELEEVMKCVQLYDGIVAIHAEEGDRIKQWQSDFISKGLTAPLYHSLSRPAETESNAVAKVIDLVRKTNCKTYIVHVSTADSVKLIREAKAEGLPIMAETCPQYLLLDESLYQQEFAQSAKFVISPPLRTQGDRDELWKGLADGTFDCVATDHCPFNYGQKSAGKTDFTKIPNGAGGVEYRLALLYTYGVLQGRISLQQWVALTSTNAARIFGFGDMGQIRVGAKATFIIWDPLFRQTISVGNSIQKCDLNIYDGIPVKGKMIEYLED